MWKPIWSQVWWCGSWGKATTTGPDRLPCSCSTYGQACCGNLSHSQTDTASLQFSSAIFTSNRGERRGIMKIPERVQPLVKEGLVDEVICQFMTGKEAMVDAVRCGDGIRCAKVYKESSSSSFRRASVTRRA